MCTSRKMLLVVFNDIIWKRSDPNDAIETCHIYTSLATYESVVVLHFCVTKL
jgi:hypothetical protein